MQVQTYQRVGGAEGLQSLVERFYELMDTLPEAAPIRALHPKDLTTSQEKLYEFLSGWLGGPNLYQEKYGHPRLRARHLPFAIGVAERDQWLLCMKQALDESSMDMEMKGFLMDRFGQVADFMRNQPDEE